jgi:two-component system LytT family response regulator
MDLAERERRVFALLQEFKPQPQYLQWLLVPDGGRLRLINVDQVTWIEAQGNYVRVYHDQGSDLVRESIGALESQLNPLRFLRIHRSAIVHLARIKELRRWQHGEYQVILENGTKLMLTRTYRASLQRALKNGEMP